MKNKTTKIFKRRISKRRLFNLALIYFFVSVVFIFANIFLLNQEYKIVKTIISLNQYAKEKELEISELKRKEKELKYEEKLINNKEYKEVLIRKRFDKGTEGEKVILFIDKPEEQEGKKDINKNKKWNFILFDYLGL